MAEALERIKYKFTTTDLRNFLVLFGNHLKKENLPLIPNGFILKPPVEFIREDSNTYIDIIGIPFRNVINRKRIHYHRITLSEFCDRYKFKLGTKNRPLRVKYTGDDDTFLDAIADKISLSLDIPKNNFILKIADFNIEPKAIEIKFNIPETEFTTKDSGLCLYNDERCYLYVTDPSSLIIGRLMRYNDSSIIDEHLKTISSSARSYTSQDYDILTSELGLLSEDELFVKIKSEESMTFIPESYYTKEPGYFKIVYKIPENIVYSSINIDTFGNELSYTIDKVNNLLIVDYDAKNHTPKIDIKYNLLTKIKPALQTIYFYKDLGISSSQSGEILNLYTKIVPKSKIIGSNIFISDFKQIVNERSRKIFSDTIPEINKTIFSSGSIIDMIQKIPKGKISINIKTNIPEINKTISASAATYEINRNTI